MKQYRAETNADLVFSFPDDLNWHELDRQGVKLPEQMKLVDLVIEREHDVLLVEIKDPSNQRTPLEGRKEYFKRLLDNSVLKHDLTPKARSSYTFLHLMELDAKPFKYVVLLGLDAFDSDQQKALLIGFKDRLLADIRCETDAPWRRQHIADCIVMSIDIWNKSFAGWQVARDPVAVAIGEVVP